MFCINYIETKWFIFSSEIPNLLYYSHIPTAIFAILLGFFVLFNSKKELSSILFFCLNIFYSLLIFLNLILWTNSYIPVLAFVWPISQIFFFLIPITSIYFFYVYINKKDISIVLKKLLFFIILILFLVSISKLNIKIFNSVVCELETSNFLFIYQNSIFLMGFIFLFFIFFKKIFNKKLERNEKIVTHLLFWGLFLFLVLFIAAWQFAEFYGYFEFEQYGLFGMTIFLGVIGFLITKFSLFNVKLITTQFFVWLLIFLIGSQFFFIKVPINFVLNGVSFLGVVIFGFSLIKSVKKEISQKEKLLELNKNLKNTISQRESLVHLITHKVKAAFTRSKYIFSEMQGGGFGELPKELMEVSSKGLFSDNEGIKTVDLVLNAVNLQKGIIKYEKIKFDLKNIVKEGFDARSTIAQMKGLKMNLDMEEGEFIITGDPFWIREVVNNLLENALRYTKEGSINISLKKQKNNKMLLTIKDTGVGINDEDKKVLFTEGGRGKESTKINVDSTGYGLYSVKLIVEGHKGRVWGESEGEGKGSTFYVEFDLVS